MCKIFRSQLPTYLCTGVRYLPPPPRPPPYSTGRRFRYAHSDHRILLNYSKSPRKRRQPHDLDAWRFQYASSTLPFRFCYDPTTTMKIRLRLVYADGDAAATLLQTSRWSYAFVSCYIKSAVQLIYIQLNANDRPQGGGGGYSDIFILT